MADENLFPANTITGLLLAGGAGRRVGNRDKGTLPWRGRPMATHCVERMAPQVKELYISCNRSQAFYNQFDCALISDERADFQGPLAGVEAMAGHCKTEFLFLAPCDTPQLPLDLAQRLLTALQHKPGANISYARTAQREHYLCALMRGSCLATVSDFLDTGERAVRLWYRQQGAVSVDFSDTAEAFININTMTDVMVTAE